MRFFQSVLLAFIIFFINSSLFADENIAAAKFKVGVIAPLSGPLAEYGLAAKNGIEAARKQNPKDFSNIDFIYEDSQWVAKTAVSAFNKLRSLEKVSLVLNWGNPTTEAVAPLAERYAMPLIGMTLDPKVAVGKHYVVRSTNASAHFSARLAKYLKSKNYKKIGVVISENTYVQGLYDDLKASLGGDADLEIVDRYNLDDQDFRSSVTKVRNKHYDAVGVFLISGQVSTFYRQMSAQGFSVPTFGTDFFESTTEIRNAGKGIDGAVYTHLGITDAFRDYYIQKYGNDYQIAYAGNWHDMALMIGGLFNSNIGVASKQVMSLLRKDKIYEGVGGEFKFKETPVDGPYYEFPVELKRIKGESISIVND